jgi:hypothetical protein
VINGEIRLLNFAKLYFRGGTRLGAQGVIRMQGQENHLQLQDQLAGDGLVVFDGQSNEFSRIRLENPEATVMIGTGITIRTGSGNGSIGGDHIVNRGQILALDGRTISLSGIENQGVIRTTTGGAITLSGNWSNSGSITADGASITVSSLPTAQGGGTFQVRDGGLVLRAAGTTDEIRSLDVTNSTIMIDEFGRVNNAGSTISVVGDGAGGNRWEMSGGDVVGGTIRSEAGQSLRVSGAGNEIGDVRLETDLDVAAGSSVYLNGSTRVVGRTITLNGPSGAANSTLASRDDSLQSGSVVLLGGTSANNALLAHAYDTLVIPQGVQVLTATGGGLIASAVAGGWSNAGLISSRTPGQTIFLRGPGTNTGTLEALGADLIAPPPPREFYLPTILHNGGTIRATAGGDFDVKGTLIQEPSGTIHLELAGTGEESFGQVRAEKLLQLDGTLQVSLADGYAPAAGDSYTILSTGPTGTRAGPFSGYGSGRARLTGLGADLLRDGRAPGRHAPRRCGRQRPSRFRGPGDPCPALQRRQGRGTLGGRRFHLRRRRKLRGSGVAGAELQSTRIIGGRRRCPGLGGGVCLRP